MIFSRKYWSFWTCSYIAISSYLKYFSMYHQLKFLLLLYLLCLSQYAILWSSINFIGKKVEEASIGGTSKSIWDMKKSQYMKMFRKIKTFWKNKYHKNSSRRTSGLYLLSLPLHAIFWTENPKNRFSRKTWKSIFTKFCLDKLSIWSCSTIF